MDKKSELQQAWDELQEVPSYTSRFDPRETVHMQVMQWCDTCQDWHNTDNG